MTQTEIYQEMLGTFLEETGYEMYSQGDLAVRLQAAAAQIMSLYHYGDYIYRQAFPQTAQETSLDHHGALRGVKRMEASQAEGILRFGISTALTVDLRIETGTLCFTGDGTAFETVEEAALTAGETFVDVSSRAVEAGPLGNAVAGSITKMQTVPDGIETVTNPEAFRGGRAAEEDESYRSRILAAYQGLSNGANISYYEQLALSVDGIDGVQVIPRINGAGSVGLLVTSDGGAVSDKILEALKELLSDRRELGIEVVVSVPETVAVTVNAAVVPAEGYALAQAQSAVEEAIAECFAEARMGKKLYRALLSHSAMATGAIDNIIITTPEADVEIGVTQVAVLESVNLEGM